MHIHTGTVEKKAARRMNTAGTNDPHVGVFGLGSVASLVDDEALRSKYGVVVDLLRCLKGISLSILTMMRRHSMVVRCLDLDAGERTDAQLA